MNFIARMELADFSDEELVALFTLISGEMALAKPGSLEWQSGTISLDNIRREQSIRRTIRRQQPRGPAGPGF